VLWRYGWSRCPTSCDGTTNCASSVPDQYIKEYTACGILDKSLILDAYSMEDSSEDDCLTFLREIENPGVAGDMYASSASYDPTFWPLHGSIERIANLKRSQVLSGEESVFDETWYYPDYQSSMMTVGAYVDGVCDWSAVKDSNDLTLPTCTLGVWCTGHYEDDVLEFTNFLGKGETYTNAEMYTFINPWNDDLPYTYDTFDFDYCQQDGYTFEPTDSAAKKIINEKEAMKLISYGTPMRRL